MPGIRKLTKEQFADGTTIDGNRIDRALADACRRAGNIRRGDLRSRFLEGVMVSGLLPITTSETAGADELPFMKTPNEAGDYYDNSIDPTPRNIHRVKGVHENGISNHFVWEASFKTDRPIVVTGLDVSMFTDDTDFTNDWHYDTSPPGDKTANDDVVDINVLLTVDNPWDPENRAAGSVALARHRFRAEAEFFNEVQLAVPASDMLPAHPGGTITESVWVSLEDVNVPIPRDSRIRWCVAFPEENFEPWGGTPVHMQYYSMTMHYKEEVRDDG